MIGVLCPCVPAELLHAAGFEPMVFPSVASATSRADGHLPPACCGLARSALEVALGTNLPSLRGMVLQRTCDTMAFLGDIWPHAVAGATAATLNLPRAPESPHARAYLMAELARLLERILDINKCDAPTLARWRETFDLFDRRRELVARLYDLDRPLSGWLRLRVIRTAFLLPPGRSVAWLETVQGEVAAQQDRSLLGRPRVLVYGPTLPDLNLVKWVEEAGCWVVGDDLCNGWRTCHPRLNVAPDEEPLAALARWLIEAWGGCPSQHRPSRPRAARILERVAATGADGVVFALARFCDPHAFDYPALAEALRSQGIPHLLLESELTTPVGQVLTRVQAFGESLESGR